jgi:hypothetical protein
MAEGKNESGVWGDRRPVIDFTTNVFFHNPDLLRF